MPPKHRAGIQIRWTTVTYRSVLLAILVAVTLFSIVLYILFPEQTKAFAAKAGNDFSDWLGEQRRPPDRQSRAAVRQLHRHRRHGAGEEGEQQHLDQRPVQRSAWKRATWCRPPTEGIAKVVFADNTNYTIKQDSLIVIQENSTNTAQQTQVAVELTTGTVDLSTASLHAGFEDPGDRGGATASMAADSSAMVHNDPRRRPA